jgi:glyoxylate carboligase
MAMEMKTGKLQGRDDWIESSKSHDRQFLRTGYFDLPCPVCGSI